MSDETPADRFARTLDALETTDPAERERFDRTLPDDYAPRVARHARGRFVEPDLVTPSDWKWRNVRTFVVRVGGIDYRAIRVHSGRVFVGYWAVEILGTPLIEIGELE